MFILLNKSTKKIRDKFCKLKYIDLCHSPTLSREI